MESNLNIFKDFENFKNINTISKKLFGGIWLKELVNKYYTCLFKTFYDISVYIYPIRLLNHEISETITLYNDIARDFIIHTHIAHTYFTLNPTSYLLLLNCPMIFFHWTRLNHANSFLWTNCQANTYCWCTQSGQPIHHTTRREGTFLA